MPSRTFPFGLRRSPIPRARSRISTIRFRSFKDLTASGVNGDARRASHAKGEKVLTICVEGLAGFLRDATIWS